MFTFLIAVALQMSQAAPPSVARIERLHTPAFRACMADGAAARGVTVAMLDCIDDEIRRHDELLNARYRRIMERLPARRAEQLRRLQRSWIGDRDRRCGAAGRGSAGTAANLAVQECFLTQTMSRAEWLRVRYLG
jgi:uncharacterized protein YecT (DUF1311 family)